MDNNAPTLGDNDGLLRHYRLSSTVDKDNFLHILAEVKDEWHNDKWRMMYYEFNPSTENSQTYNSAYSATGNTEGKLTAVWVDADTAPENHQYHPMIVVDESSESTTPTVHVFSWTPDGDWSANSHSSMTRGGDEFVGGENPIIRNEDVSPIKALQSTSVRIDGTVMIDAITLVGTSDLRYFQIALTAAD